MYLREQKTAGIQKERYRWFLLLHGIRIRRTIPGEILLQIFFSKKIYPDMDTKREKHRILVPKGLNCRPRHPVNYSYARGMLIMHRPWSKRKPLTELLSETQETVRIFLEMIHKHRLPLYVITKYNRAAMYLQKYVHECLAKEGSTAKTKLDINNSMDREELEQELYCKHS